MPRSLTHFCNSCHRNIKIYIEEVYTVGPLGYEKTTGYLTPYPKCPLCGSPNIKIQVRDKVMISG